MWGTLIALLDDGVPVLGVLDQPITRERWLGVAGQPTTLNGANRTDDDLHKQNSHLTYIRCFDPMG